jgi:DNA topoisomerase-2
LTTEIKVAQFSGYVSEHSGYHHGEASLNGAIVGMAQTFVGSNNINLLMPNGQMGTRLRGGQDSASERYIFTQLNPLTRVIFRAEDDGVLRYLEDDGVSVEPVYYAPILPMILVNGSKGIGTGFSTEVLSYNPLEISGYIQRKLTATATATVTASASMFVPYYEGFKGQILKDSNKIMFKGVYVSVAAEKIRITELPVGMWTYDFKELLESLIDAKTFVKDYVDMSTDVLVDFEVIFLKGKKLELEEQIHHQQPFTINGIEKLLKLYVVTSTTNMHLFNAEEKLVKYHSVEEIINDFMVTRLDIYRQRKEHMLAILKTTLEISENKMRYIDCILSGAIDLRNRKREEILTLLKEMEFKEVESGFKYLLQMTMESLSEEHVRQLFDSTLQLRAKYDELMAKSIEEMWFQELMEFEEQYKKQKSIKSAKKKSH